MKIAYLAAAIGLIALPSVAQSQSTTEWHIFSASADDFCHTFGYSPEAFQRKVGGGKVEYIQSPTFRGQTAVVSFPEAPAARTFFFSLSSDCELFRDALRKEGVIH